MVVNMLTHRKLAYSGIVKLPRFAVSLKLLMEMGRT